jgi:ornithine cyclodeaminase
MALLLRESDVEQLLTMPVTIDLVERVHRDYSTGKAIDVPRERTRVPKAGLHILQGAVPSANIFGYKAYTSSREGTRFLVYGFSAERGNLEVIVEADRLGMMRTGAAGGVAAKWLSRPESKVVGVFGSGWQAEGQIEALATCASSSASRCGRARRQSSRNSASACARSSGSRSCPPPHPTMP